MSSISESVPKQINIESVVLPMERSQLGDSLEHNRLYAYCAMHFAERVNKSCHIYNRI